MINLFWGFLFTLLQGFVSYSWHPCVDQIEVLVHTLYNNLLLDQQSVWILILWFTGHLYL